MPDDVLLHGFSFSGFRSFTQSGAPLAPLKKVNILAGQNNAGKSNVLRFLAHLLKSAPEAPSSELDRPEDVLPVDWKVRMRLVVPDFALPEHLEGRARDRQVAPVLDALRSVVSPHGCDGVEFAFQLEAHHPFGGNPRAQFRWVADPAQVEDIARHLPIRGINLMGTVNLFTNQNYISGGNKQQFAAELLASLTPKLNDLPPVRIIQAFRQIRPTSDTDEGDVGLFNGVGLIQRLEQLESPKEIGVARNALRDKYDRINAFVRHILDDSSATLHIPYDASTVQIRRGTSVLPLDSLGTGVHQVVMLAAAATLLDRTLIGLEEPEVHLHPLLQRRLVRYLATQTTNQYIIATHSAQLLDYEAGSVFHLTYTDHGTEVASAGTPHELARICSDLGYRPSDLLQSNVVIWVEGPSDRIYLRRWLEDLEPDRFLEGVHYSIMFYGGGLLCHLSPDDPQNPGLSVEHHREAVEDFISLRRLNRHLAVIIDSDKESVRKRVNPTKTRVTKAFDDSEGPGFAWVTKCYTIENYIPRPLLEEAALAVHPRWRLLPDAGIWKNPLRFEGGHRPDKVAIARYVANRWPKGGLKQLDLERQVRSIRDLICTANGQGA